MVRAVRDAGLGHGPGAIIADLAARFEPADLAGGDLAAEASAGGVRVQINTRYQVPPGPGHEPTEREIDVPKE